MNTATTDMFDIDEEKIKEVSTNLIDQKSRVVIDSQQSLENATDLASIINKRLKKIELDRVATVKPFNDGVRNINKKYKDGVADMVKALAELKTMILVYTNEQERLAKIERDRLIKEAEEKALADAAEIEQAGETEVAETIVEKAAVASNITKHVGTGTQTMGHYGSSNTRKVRKWRIKDLRNIPIRFLQLDESEIKKFLTEEKNKALVSADQQGLKGKEREAFLKETASKISINGLEFFFENAISIR